MDARQDVTKRMIAAFLGVSHIEIRYEPTNWQRSMIVLPDGSEREMYQTYLDMISLLNSGGGL